MAIHGQTSQAISVYQQAIRQNPKDASAYYNLGVTLYNQGNYKKANGVLKRARNEYREQGNIEQAEKIEQLMQQIAQKTKPQQPQVSQTATTPSQSPNPTTNVAAPEQQMPNQSETLEQTPAEPADVPVSVEQQPTSTSPTQ